MFYLFHLPNRMRTPLNHHKHTSPFIQIYILIFLFFLAHIAKWADAQFDLPELLLYLLGDPNQSPPFLCRPLLGLRKLDSSLCHPKYLFNKFYHFEKKKKVKKNICNFLFYIYIYIYELSSSYTCVAFGTGESTILLASRSLGM